MNNSEIPFSNYALSPEAQKIIRAYFNTLEPLAKQTSQILRQIYDVDSYSPEMRETLKLCQQFYSAFYNSEELKKAQEIAACIAEQLNTPEFKATMVAVAKAAQLIMNGSIEALRQFQEDSLVIPEDVPATTATEPAAVVPDWVDPVIPIDLHGIWKDVENKNGLITSALTMSSILLPRLVEPADTDTVRDGTDALLFSVLFAAFLNILVRAYGKRIDKIRNKR